MMPSGLEKFSFGRAAIFAGGLFVLSASVAISAGTASDAQTTSDRSAVPKLVKLESLSFEEVCGLDSQGQTSCLRGRGESTWIPEGIGNLISAFANEYVSCGFDQTGLKCWKMPSSSSAIDGEAAPQAFRKLLETAKPASIRLSTSNTCAINSKSGRLKCLVPDWYMEPRRSFEVSPRTSRTGVFEIHQMDAGDNLICWAERLASAPASGPRLSHVICRSSDQIEKTWPALQPIEDLSKLVSGDGWFCYQSKNKTACFSEQATVALPAEFTLIKNLSAASGAICGLTHDGVVLCANPKTGTIAAPGSNHDVPPEYQTPSANHLELWVGMANACVLHKDGMANCWSWWSPLSTPVKFSKPAVKLFGSGYQFCALFANGQAECRLYQKDSQTLSNSDRIRVEFNGYNKCFWNSSGIDCRGRIDEIEYQSVTAVSASRESEALCVIGVLLNDASRFDSVRCYSYNTAIDRPPIDLTNPKAVANTDDQACALSDEGLICWGEPYAEVPMPNNVSKPQKLVLAQKHACVIDEFGLVCWGELSSLNLEIPKGLDQPGRVIDIALGTSRSCAVLDTGAIQCWGRDYELSGPPPQLTRATSIIGRGGLFCAVDGSGAHCWGGDTGLPK